MSAIAPRLHDIEARAQAAREQEGAAPETVALAQDVDWLLTELHAAWAREVALRARRPSAEWRVPLDPSR
jgi:hypothetical protein